LTNVVTRELADVARLLPDLPEWIEVRSMLLRQQARLIGSVSTSPPTFVALYQDGDQAAVVGRASRASILEAARTATEILAATEDTAWLAGTLPDWEVESALLFRRAAGSPLLGGVGDVRLLATGEVATITGGTTPLVPPALVQELRDAEKSGAPIAASFEGKCAAAFCYAGSITETLWDISIDTLEPYQRRGHAMRVVAFLIEHYRVLGKEPVWGALVSNHASRALAARLGFEAAGSLSIFSAPGVVDT
jgi:hypothetical protein